MITKKCSLSCRCGGNGSLLSGQRLPLRKRGYWTVPNHQSQQCPLPSSRDTLSRMRPAAVSHDSPAASATPGSVRRVRVSRHAAALEVLRRVTRQATIPLPTAIVEPDSSEALTLRFPALEFRSLLLNAIGRDSFPDRSVWKRHKVQLGGLLLHLAAGDAAAYAAGLDDLVSRCVAQRQQQHAQRQGRGQQRQGQGREQEEQSAEVQAQQQGRMGQEGRRGEPAGRGPRHLTQPTAGGVTRQPPPQDMGGSSSSCGSSSSASGSSAEADYLVGAAAGAAGGFCARGGGCAATEAVDTRDHDTDVAAIATAAGAAAASVSPRPDDPEAADTAAAGSDVPWYDNMYLSYTTSSGSYSSSVDGDAPVVAVGGGAAAAAAMSAPTSCPPSNNPTSPAPAPAPATAPPPVQDPATAPPPARRGTRRSPRESQRAAALRANIDKWCRTIMQPAPPHLHQQEATPSSSPSSSPSPSSFPSSPSCSSPSSSSSSSPSSSSSSSPPLSRHAAGAAAFAVLRPLLKRVLELGEPAPLVDIRRNGSHTELQVASLMAGQLPEGWRLYSGATFLRVDGAAFPNRKHLKGEGDLLLVDHEGVVQALVEVKTAKGNPYVALYEDVGKLLGLLRIVRSRTVTFRHGAASAPKVTTLAFSSRLRPIYVLGCGGGGLGPRGPEAAGSGQEAAEAVRQKGEQLSRQQLEERQRERRAATGCCAGGVAAVAGAACAADSFTARPASAPGNGPERDTSGAAATTVMTATTTTATATTASTTAIASHVVPVTPPPPSSPQSTPTPSATAAAAAACSPPSPTSSSSPSFSFPPPSSSSSSSPSSPSSPCCPLSASAVLRSAWCKLLTMELGRELSSDDAAAAWAGVTVRQISREAVVLTLPRDAYEPLARRVAAYFTRLAHCGVFLVNV